MALVLVHLQAKKIPPSGNLSSSGGHGDKITFRSNRWRDVGAVLISGFQHSYSSTCCRAVYWRSSSVQRFACRLPFQTVKRTQHQAGGGSGGTYVLKNIFCHTFLHFEQQLSMVSLLVATKADPASIGPASALLSLWPSWTPGPEVDHNPTYATGRVRMIQLQGKMVHEDLLERRWEAQTGEKVEEMIFMSRHTAASNRPALTIHPIGIPHLQKHDTPPAGGKPGCASPPNSRIGPWFRLLKSSAIAQKLVPEFEITLEATHHGPWTQVPAMFVEIGSTEEYWKREDAANTVASVFIKGLGLDGGSGIGFWSQEKNQGERVLLGLGGGHYAPRHMDIVQKKGVWVGHLLSGYSLLMDEPDPKVKDYNKIVGTWKEAIREAVAATRSAFPGGEVIVHLDSKSFKSWQRSAITWFLGQEGVKIGKPGDFISS